MNQKIYIGQTIGIRGRFYYHRTRGHLGRNKLSCCFKKYGFVNFKKEIIYRTKPGSYECIKTELNKKEIYYINLYDSFYTGFNNTHGGNSISYSEIAKIKQKNSKIGKKHSSESKEKMRLSHLGKKASNETKLKMSKVRKGRKHNYSAEALEKLRLSNHIAHLGKKASNETKLKMSKSHAGKKHSSESKEKIHISLLGKKHPHVGTKHSLESKEKMRLSQLRKKHSMEAILEINKNYLRKKLLLCAKILKHYLERNMTR